MSKEVITRSCPAIFGAVLAAATLSGTQKSFAADPLCEASPTAPIYTGYEILLMNLMLLDVDLLRQDLDESKKRSQWTRNHEAEFRAMTEDQRKRQIYTQKTCDAAKGLFESAKSQMTIIQRAMDACASGFGLTAIGHMTKMRNFEKSIKGTMESSASTLSECEKVGVIPRSPKPSNSAKSASPPAKPPARTKADANSPVTRSDFQAQDPERQKTVLRQLVRKVWKADCKPISIAAGPPHSGEINHWSIKCEGSSLAQDYVVQLPTALDKPARVLKCYAEPGATKCDMEGKPSRAAQDKRG